MTPLLTELIILFLISGRSDKLLGSASSRWTVSGPQELTRAEAE